MTDFTSSVYIKKEKIKENIDVILKNDGLGSNLCLMKQPEGIKICIRWKTDCPICKKWDTSVHFVLDVFNVQLMTGAFVNVVTY